MGQQSYITSRVYVNAKMSRKLNSWVCVCVILSKVTTICIIAISYIDFYLLFLFDNFIVWICFSVLFFSVYLSLKGEIWWFSSEYTPIWKDYKCVDYWFDYRFTLWLLETAYSPVISGGVITVLQSSSHSILFRNECETRLHLTCGIMGTRDRWRDPTWW